MTDPDKTDKIETIRRTVPLEQLIEHERQALKFFERQAEIARERLRERGVAA